MAVNQPKENDSKTFWRKIKGAGRLWVVLVQRDTG